MTVASILKGKGRDIAAARGDDTLIDITRRLQEHKIGAILVVNESGALEGILSERDIVRAIAARGAEVLKEPVSRHMTANVITCVESDTVSQLMGKMTAGRFRHMPVMDGRKIVGVVSIGDVVKARIAEAESEAEAMRSYITAN